MHKSTRYRSLIIVACSLFSHHTSVYTKKPQPPLYILIHGTWASPKHWLIHKTPQWYQDGHPSLETLKKVTGAEILVHAWAGNNHLTERIKGAQALIKILVQHLGTRPIHIIGHSHGGNVALLALDYLARHHPHKKIDALILLGTPIYSEWYPLGIKAAHRIYNLFSYGDIIQPVGGMYERTLPEHEHIFNIQVKLNGTSPFHNQLYKAEILKHVVDFSKLFGKKGIYCLHCVSGKKPEITHDSAREKDLEIDKKFTQQLLTSWTEIRDNHAKSLPTNNYWPARLWNRGAEYCKTVATFIQDGFSAYEV